MSVCNNQSTGSAFFHRRIGRWCTALLLLMFLLAAGMMLPACGPSQGPEERSSRRQAGQQTGESSQQAGELSDQRSQLSGDSWPEVLEKGYGTLYALYVPAEGFAYVDSDGRLTGVTALAFEGTLHEERLRRLIRDFGPGLEIRMAHTNDEILDLTASGNHYFAYIDLYNYQRAADRGMPLQRHEAGDDPAEQFGYTMPLETSWVDVVEEYFRFDGGLTTTPRYREVMETHLGKELAGVLLEAADVLLEAPAGQAAAAGKLPGPGATQDLPEGFGYVHKFIPRAVPDVRYAYNDNFLGVPVDGYLEHVVILTNEALEALARAEATLHEKGYGIIVFDGFRPKKAVNHFLRWARDVSDTLTKQKYYPGVDKSMLFELGYISGRSGHSRGSTVDLTLFDLDTGKELDMGSGFDFFGPASSHRSPLITDKQQKNREILLQAMLDHGFVPFQKEWWHYTLSNEPFPDTYFDFDVR